MQIIKSHDWKWILLNLVLCFLIGYSINGVYFINPNSHMHSIGGDALTIYYDVAYHVCYGDGDMLTGMNYPDGELIFLTDGQGTLAIILNWINKYLFTISDYTVGIINWLNAISILLCSFFVQLVFREFKASHLNAAIFSPLITIMSPQIFRVSGHFGLAYLFIIPFFFLWVIRRSKNPGFHYTDILVFLLLLGLTFNNPYTGFISCSILIFSGAFIWVKNRFDWTKLYISAVGVLGLLLPFIYFKIFDPVDDRIKIQWGFFEYKASILGYISPNGTLTSDIVKLLGFNVKEIQFEALMYIGIVSLILLFLLVSLFFFKSNNFRYSVPSEFLPLLVASVILFLYASGTLFLPFDQDTMEDKLNVLLMFKAAGRLGWPMYFSLTMLSVLFLDHLIIKVPLWLKVICTILPCLVWNWEVNTYIKPKFRDHVYENFFDKGHSEKVLSLLKDNNINKDSFQAILTLPKMMSWNDNIICDVNWSAQFHSMKISLATGLPMVNAMLSRMSVGQVSERIELLANPLIYKSVVDKFPNQKDLLIVLGFDHQHLTIGENFLLEISDTIYHEPNGYTLLRLPLKKINNNKYFESKRLLIGDTLYQNVAHFYNGFENEAASDTYFGKGAKQYNKGDRQIFFDTIKNPLSDKYTFSIWTKIDHQKYGLGWFKCEVKRQNGDVIYKEVPDTRRSNDVQDDWIRTELTFPVDTNCTVEVSYFTTRDMIIDELLIRPDTSTIIFQDDTKKEMLYNGFRIK